MTANLPDWLRGARFVALIVVLSGCGHAPSPGPGRRDRMDASDIIEKVSIMAADSYLQESRGKPGAGIRDFQEVFRAEDIDPARHVAVTNVSGRRIDGRALLWFTPDFTVAVVDRKWFTDLKSVDANRLPAGGSVAVGRFRDPSLRAMTGRQLLWFLVESGVILTYAHISSEVSLVREADDAAAYEADLRGSHVYFTNKRHEAPFALKVAFDKKTGDITVSSPTK